MAKQFLDTLIAAHSVSLKYHKYFEMLLLATLSKKSFL